MLRHPVRITLGETPYGTVYAIDRSRVKTFNPKKDTIFVEVTDASSNDSAMAQTFLGLHKLTLQKWRYDKLTAYTSAMQKASTASCNGDIAATENSLQAVLTSYQALIGLDATLNLDELVQQSAENKMQILLQSAQNFTHTGAWEKIEDLKDEAITLGETYAIEVPLDEFDEHFQHAFDVWQFSHL